MSHLETHRTWYFSAPSESDSWLCPRMPSPQLSVPVVRTSVSTEEEEQDMLTMSGAVLYSRGTASCSWKWALCYTTAVRRLQRQRLCQQTEHFKAVATIVGSNREERSCLWVPKANWSLRRKTGSRRILLRNNEEKTAHLCGTKARVLKKLFKLLPHPINIFSSTYGMSLSQLPPPDMPVSEYP